MVDLQRQISRNMNILHVKSIELTHILCVRCGFRRSLPFLACFAITVIPVIQRNRSVQP